MVKAGADLIEIGIPFSDPVAEGTVIQEADLRALKAGTTTDKIFDMVAEVRKETDIPLAFMTYMNPVFVYGTERFCKNAPMLKLMHLLCLTYLMKKRTKLHRTVKIRNRCNFAYCTNL